MARRIAGLLLLSVSAGAFRPVPSRARLRRLGLAATPEPAADAPRLLLQCPAKLNLFLRVVRRREDGFHDLASLFQTLALGDTLELAPLPEAATADVLHCDTEGVPTDGRNLVIKALELFRAKSGVTTKFDAVLVKATPAEAGLGGGSSDAAAAMFGANALSGFPATEAELLEWSGDIGSDISFFFSGGTAYCTGRGEVVEPLAPLPNPPEELFLVKPGEGLSTPHVFKALDLDKRSPVPPEELLQGFLDGGVDTGLLVNDLEPPAFDCLPRLAELKEKLRGLGFEKVMMSGSGTTLFALGRPRDDAGLLQLCIAEDLFLSSTRFTQREAGSKEWYPVGG